MGPNYSSSHYTPTDCRMATAGDSAGNVYAARKNAKKLGARAYLLKSELDKELLGTIRAVHNAK
jgi:hypothetical protein